MKKADIITDLQDCKTPEELYKTIDKLLMNFKKDHCSEADLETVCFNAQMDVVKFRKIYSTLQRYDPSSGTKDNAETGLREIMDWCIDAIDVVDEIPSRLNAEVIENIISLLNELKKLPASKFPSVDDSLWQKAKARYKEATKKGHKKEIESNSKEILSWMDRIKARADRRKAIFQEAYFRKNAIRKYMSMDTNFKDRLSEFGEEINHRLQSIQGLVSGKTANGKLMDAYCDLKGIPWKQRCEGVGDVFQDAAILTEAVMFGQPDLYITCVDEAIAVLNEVSEHMRSNSISARREPTETKHQAISDIWQRFINWLRKHPHSYGLIGGFIFLLIFFVIGFFKIEWRNWCWGTAVVALLVLVLSLLGGKSHR